MNPKQPVICKMTLQVILLLSADPPSFLTSSADPLRTRLLIKRLCLSVSLVYFVSLRQGLTNVTQAVVELAEMLLPQPSQC